MGKVVVVDHPLVQHKLSLMRDKKCGTKDFRQLLEEIGMLMAYEVTRDLPLKEISLRLAYSSQSYFASVFKKFAGLSPKQYRIRYYRRNLDGLAAE